MTDTAEQTTETTATPEATEPSRYTLLSNEPEPEATTEPEPEPEKPKRDANERIRKLNERTIAAEAETARLKAELESRNVKTTVSTDTEPNPDDYVGGVFNDKYRADLREYARQIARAEIQAEQHAAQLEESRLQVINRENKFKAENPDYDYAVRNFMAAGLANEGIADLLIDLPNGFEIVNQIGNDEDLIDELKAMPLAQRLIKIGALSVAGQAAQPTTKRVSTAATPITPVSGGSAVLTGQAAIEAAEKAQNYDAWKAAKKAAGK